MASRSTSPGRRPDIEKELDEKFHVGWTYHEGISTDQFDIEASKDNQARFEAINQATVEQYVEAVQRGDLFPAVIAYRKRKGGKLIIIDGNHRLVAHAEAGEAIDCYEVEHGTRPTQITFMTYALNAKHGRGTSEDERVEHALYLIDNNTTIPDAAAAMNLAERVVRRAANRKKAEARATEVGVDVREWEALGQSARSRLLNISTDEGLKDAVHLCYVAGLKADEVFELASQVNETGRSATKQRALIKAKTLEYQDRIQANGGGIMNANGNRRGVTPKARLGMVIGQVASLPEDVVAIAKTFGPAERDEVVQSLTDASHRLAKIAAAIKG